MSKVWELLIRILGHRTELVDVLGKNLSRFQCYCGLSHLIFVPETKGALTVITCDRCFLTYQLVWQGDSFAMEVRHPLIESDQQAIKQTESEPESPSQMFARMQQPKY